jgi:hypothetical protein
VLKGHYEKTDDRESAYEKLRARAQEKGAGEVRGGIAPDKGAGKSAGTSTALNDLLFGKTGPRGGHHDGLIQAAAKSAARSIGSGAGRQILRGILGSLFGGKSR